MAGKHVLDHSLTANSLTLNWTQHTTFDLEHDFCFNLVGCDAGSYNDLATPFMSMPGDTIRAIFSIEGGHAGRQTYSTCNVMSSCHFTPQSLGLLSAFYLVLMALASGVAVPGGLFMPSIMVRSSLTALPKSLRCEMVQIQRVWQVEGVDLLLLSSCSLWDQRVSSVWVS